MSINENSKIYKAAKYVFVAALGVLGGHYIGIKAKVDLRIGDEITDETQFDSVKDRPASKVAQFSIKDDVISFHGVQHVSTLGAAYERTTDRSTPQNVRDKVIQLAIIYNDAGAEIARTVCRPNILMPTKVHSCDLFMIKPQP